MILAGIEAALALMRDMLIADKAALLQTLSATQSQPQAADGWFARIPTAGQMILGFILPFALAFVAIPLESFIYSLRTVVGVFLVILIRALAFALRFAATVSRQIGRMSISFYDVLIVLPLMVERMVKPLLASGASGKKGRGPMVDDDDVLKSRTERL